MYHKEEKKSVCLSGEWQLCWQDTDKRKIEEDDTLWETAVKCMIPGDVHDALAQAGIIKEPLLDVNSKECR